ncbi:MAG TPA: response regulator transcription factor [Chitinophagaceae bacterium]|nr:response regulator transcription factor [Chitinophagaceae bacterium]
MKTTISIVEDDDFFIEILNESIIKDSKFSVEAIYKNYESAMKGFPLNPTDIMLVDVQLPDELGIHLISRFKSKFPLVHFIICTSFIDADFIFKGLKAGAIGYIHKSEAMNSITEAIHEAIDGGAPMSANVARKVVDFFYKSAKNGLDILTSKENEILSLLAEGYLYKEIGGKLGISLDTVKKHTSNIYRKLHVHNRTEAINLYLER